MNSAGSAGKSRPNSSQVNETNSASSNPTPTISSRPNAHAENSQSFFAPSESLNKLANDLWKRQDKIGMELFQITYGALVTQIIKDYEMKTKSGPEIASKHVNIRVNNQLDKIGYQMGCRIIDDFLANVDEFMSLSGINSIDTNAGNSEFRRSMAWLAGAAFRMYLNCSPKLLFISNNADYPLLQHVHQLQKSNDKSCLDECLLVFGTAGEGLLASQPALRSTSQSAENPLTQNILYDIPQNRNISVPEQRLWYSQIFCGLIRGCLEMINMDAQVEFVPSMSNAGDSGLDEKLIRVRLLRYLDEEFPVDEE